MRAVRLFVEMPWRRLGLANCRETSDLARPSYEVVLSRFAWKSFASRNHSSSVVIPSRSSSKTTLRPKAKSILD